MGLKTLTRDERRELVDVCRQVSDVAASGWPGPEDEKVWPGAITPEEARRLPFWRERDRMRRHPTTGPAT